MRFLLIVWLLGLSWLGLAQQRKPDVINRNSGKPLTGYVVQVTDKVVRYRLLAQPNAPLYTLPRAQVRSIQYSSGKTLQIGVRTQLLARPTLTDPSVRPPDVSRPDSPTVAKAATALSATSAPSVTTLKTELPVPALPRIDYSYMSIVLGIEGNYAVPALSPQWADNAIGLGIRQGTGGSLLVTRRFNRWIGSVIQTGYGRWMVERRYNQDTVFMYGAGEKLEHLSFKFAPKIYIISGLYVQPNLIMQLRRLTSTTSESHPISSLNKSQSELTWGYGGELGYELIRGRFMAKLAVGYSYVRAGHKPLVWYYPLNSPLQSLDIQLGLGFNLPASRPLNPATR